MARHFQYCSMSGHPYATPFPVLYITLPATCASVLFYSAALCATNLRTPAGPLENGIERIPLLAEEGWRDSLIEAGAPGAKREPDRAKPQLVVSSAKSVGCRSDHPVCAASVATRPPLQTTSRA